MTSSWRGIALRLGISLGALSLIVYLLHDHLGEALHILTTDVKVSWVILAFATYFVCLILLSLRLMYVFKAQEISISFPEIFYLTFIGLFFNLFFPSAVGGDVAKAYYVYKHTGQKLASTTSVILDRLMGFVAIILMAVLAFFVMGKQFTGLNIDYIVFGFFMLMVATIAFFGSKRFARCFQFMKYLVPSEKWRGRISDLYHAIHNYKNHPVILIMCILLSFVGTTCFIMLHYWLARGLGVSLHPGLFFMLVPLVTIASMAPSLGGLGVREAGVTYFFSRFMVMERAIALSLLLDAVIYGFCIVAGIVYSMRGGLKSKMIHEMEDME